MSVSVFWFSALATTSLPAKFAALAFSRRLRDEQMPKGTADSANY